MRQMCQVYIVFQSYKLPNPQALWLPPLLEALARPFPPPKPLPIWRLPLAPYTLLTRDLLFMIVDIVIGRCKM